MYRGIVACGLFATSLSGCQSYAPNPPDLAAHHAMWLNRTAASDEVATFAEALRRNDASNVHLDASDRLTLAEAEIVALVLNADLRLERSRAGITRATLDQAGLWDDPVLNLGFERMLSSVDHPWEVFGSIGLTVPISGRLEREKQRADASHHAQLYRVAEQEWQVRSQLRNAWVEWSAATEKSRVAGEFLDRLEDIVAIVRRMEEVGELARVRAGLFHIELHTRRNEARSFEARARHAEIELRRLMGVPSDLFVDTIALTPQIVIERPMAESNEAVERIRERHPRLLVRHAEHTTAERTLELEIRKQYPDLVIGPGYGYEDGNNQLLMGVSIPLPIFNRNRQRIAEALAEREHARAALETEYEQLLSALAVAENDRAAARDQLDRMTETIIPLVDQQFADARRVAELGEVDTLLLLDTLRRQYEAKLDLIELRAKQSLAHLRMIELLGPDADGPIRATPAGDHDEEEPSV